jgi:hypothetical protein
MLQFKQKRMNDLGLFEAELGHWDRELRPQKKIPLLVDNCPAHNVSERLVGEH